MSAFSDMPKTLRNAGPQSGRQNNDRRFPGVTGRAPHNKIARRTTAAIVQAHRASRTAQQQLAELDRRLGKGVGAKRERARLRRGGAA